MVLMGTTYYVTGFGAAPKFSCIFRFAVLFILSVSFLVKVGDGPGKMAHLWYENQKFELTLQRMAEKLVKWKVHILPSLKYRKTVKVYKEII